MKKTTLPILALLLAISGGAIAETAEEMQQRLNEEVSASAFNAGDFKKASAYAEDALKKGIQPVMVAPAYWVPGSTCSYLTTYRYYHYDDYRNCVYYHRYYGHYW